VHSDPGAGLAVPQLQAKVIGNNVPAQSLTQRSVIDKLPRKSARPGRLSEALEEQMRVDARDACRRVEARRGRPPQPAEGRGAFGQGMSLATRTRTSGLRGKATRRRDCQLSDSAAAGWSKNMGFYQGRCGCRAKPYAANNLTRSPTERLR